MIRSFSRGEPCYQTTLPSNSTADGRQYIGRVSDLRRVETQSGGEAQDGFQPRSAATALSDKYSGSLFYAIRLA